MAFWPHIRKLVRHIGALPCLRGKSGNSTFQAWIRQQFGLENVPRRAERIAAVPGKLSGKLHHDRAVRLGMEIEPAANGSPPGDEVRSFLQRESCIMRQFFIVHRLDLFPWSTPGGVNGGTISPPGDPAHSLRQILNTLIDCLAPIADHLIAKYGALDCMGPRLYPADFQFGDDRFDLLITRPVHRITCAGQTIS